MNSVAGHFALFLLEFAQYFTVALGFSTDLHLFLLLPSARHVAMLPWMPCLPHQSNLPSRFCSFTCILSDNINHIISPRIEDFSFSLYQGSASVM